MGLDDKIGNAAKDAVGNAKEGLGKLTGNEDLQADGLQDQAAAEAGKVGERVQDTAEELGKKLGGN